MIVGRISQERTATEFWKHQHGAARKEKEEQKAKFKQIHTAVTNGLHALAFTHRAPYA